MIDADAALDRTVAELVAAGRHGHRLDAVVVSGDLTDSGDPDAYRRLRAALTAVGVPILFATGNHDERATFHRVLLGIDNAEPVVQQLTLGGGLRLVALDSSVASRGHGRLAAQTLADLADILRNPAPAGTLVVLHHAPLPPPSPLLSCFALERESRRALAAAVADTDVRLILAGHHHLAQSGMLGGVPVAVAGSTAIRTDPLAAAGHERTTTSGAFNLVRVYPDTVVVSVIPVDGAAQVFDLDPARCAEVISAHSAT